MNELYIIGQLENTHLLRKGSINVGTADPLLVQFDLSSFS